MSFLRRSRRVKPPSAAKLPIRDYSLERERAIQWLGDKYVLDKPINQNASSKKHRP